MTRTFSFLFLFLTLVSCGKGGGGGSGGSSSDAASLTDADITTSEVAPVEAQTFEINAKLSGFTRDQEDKIHQAFELIKKVVASDEFKKKVLARKKYVDSNYSSATIYKKILQASEKLNQGANNTMDLELKAYTESANVIGYTKPSIKTVYVNTRYLNKRSFTANEVAMNLTHEWLHKLGFKHAAKKTPTRANSVPYAIGYIMRSLAAKVD
jgi:hypothetical protein